MAKEPAPALVTPPMKPRKPYWIKRFDQRGRGQYWALNFTKRRTVSIVNECCCGYVKGIALDPLGWRPLIEAIEARSDWFEVIHLYGTKSGWDRLKELVAAHGDVAARYQALIDLTAPAARNIDAYWLARRAPAGETIHDSRQPIHKMPAPSRNDPCPCDSGKKFKHSHGEPETLH
jgi:uncharacterized protein